MNKILISLLCLLPVITHAEIVLDASHLAWTQEDPVLVVGGNSGQMYAQTFEAQNSAPLVRVDLVIGCKEAGSGAVTVEIQKVDVDGLPNGAVLGSISVDSHTLLDFPFGVHEFPITGVGLHAGDNYGIVVSGESTVDCGMREGRALFGVSYPDGEAFVASPPSVPDWQPVEFSGGTNDLAFWVYVLLTDPSEPRYCEIETFTGTPGSWLISGVPLCGCVQDNTLLNNRCWFTFPEWTVWREIPLPYEQPTGKAIWWVVPFNSDFPGLFILESDLDGFEFSGPVGFKPGLSPGTVHKTTVPYEGHPKGTLVDFEFKLDGEPVHVQFETLIDIPPQ